LGRLAVVDHFQLDLGCRHGATAASRHRAQRIHSPAVAWDEELTVRRGQQLRLVALTDLVPAALGHRAAVLAEAGVERPVIGWHPNTAGAGTRTCGASSEHSTEHV